MPKARRICSWCEKFLGMTDLDTYAEGSVTHGICDACLNDMIKKDREAKGEEKKCES